MPDFRDNRLFTPPTLKPLNLDLASLNGGGSHPAQFYGETHDGREIYCRYRGGCLSVQIAENPCDEAYDAPRIVDERIGPRYHTFISIGQLCRHAGISINGDVPPMPNKDEIRREGYCDLSGGTSYYFFDMRSTLTNARCVLADMMREASGIQVYQPILGEESSSRRVRCSTVDDIKVSRLTLLIGPPFQSDDMSKFIDEIHFEGLSQEAVVGSVVFTGFGGRMPKYQITSQHKVESKLGVGAELEVAGTVDDCTYASFLVSVSFPAKDVAKRARVMELDRLLSACFPVQTLLCFDLETGERCPDYDVSEPMDPNIIKWMQGAGNRWWRITTRDNDDNNVLLGHRPSPSGNANTEAYRLISE